MSTYLHITENDAFDRFVATLPSPSASADARPIANDGTNRASAGERESQEDSEASGGEPASTAPIAADIEAELNLHVYGERFCLLQLFDGTRAAVVDPMSVSMDRIKSFLESPRIPKIFYDAASDRTLLYKSHRILLRGTVDLKVAVELLEMKKQGLDSVLESILGIEPPASKKRFQQYDWTKRPIRPEAIDYALRDVISLFRLRDELFARLAEAGLTGEFERENARRDEIVPDLNRKPGVLRSRRFERMSKGRQREFARLYEIRERYAERLDMPPNSVLSNNDLFSVAAGKLQLDDVRPNRRVPRREFDAMRREMTERSGEG